MFLQIYLHPWHETWTTIRQTIRLKDKAEMYNCTSQAMSKDENKEPNPSWLNSKNNNQELAKWNRNWHCTPK